MSHITTVQTELDNIELIKKALTYLGFSYKENSSIRMWRSSKDVLLIIPLQSYDIGIQGKDNKYYLEADSYAWNDKKLHKTLKDYNLQADSDGTQFSGILKQACNMVKAAVVAQSLNQHIEFSKPDKNNLIVGKVRTIS